MTFIDVIAGTRPNLVKAAAVLHAIRELEVNPNRVRFIYTSQHFDDELFRGFSSRLGIGEPDVVLEPPASSDLVLSSVYSQYESLLRELPPPSLTIVFGDVTSTLAATMAARFARIPVAHVEAGLRSHNWMMPEEVIRVAVDAVSTHAFVTSRGAADNLVHHDNLRGSTFFVGNTMIDSLVRFLADSKNQALQAGELASKPMMIVTLHRPSNVDDSVRLRNLVELLWQVSENFSVVFPVHPRTADRLRRGGLDLPPGAGVPPIPYFEFISLLTNASAVLTDSGGLSEEATYLGIPCITMRGETERPETVEIGTNVLVGDEMDVVQGLLRDVLEKRWKAASVPPLWDGKAGERIVNKLIELGFVG